jgi:hypothetical protein
LLELRRIKTINKVKDKDVARSKNPKKSALDNEITEIVTDAIGESEQPVVNAAEATGTPKITIDGVGYEAANLSDAAKGAVASLQFAEAKIRSLQNELAVCQTAHFANVKGLKAELEGKAV